jgi:arabinogalactan endo-1,4-beta-galactosidase
MPLRMTRVALALGLAAVSTVVCPAPASAATLSMLGADVSSVQRTIDLGGRYYYANGTQGDPLDILKSVGVNYVRLRVWNNPASGYNNAA